METRPAVERWTEKQARQAPVREWSMLEALPGVQQDFLRCK
jgi:hypothetical protein